MTSANPSPGLDPRAEDVQPGSDVALWTESFHGSGYDPDRGVGIFVHVARAQFDPRLWDETFVAFLPDGEFLAHRGFGYGEVAEGPTPNSVSYVYKKPFEEWDLRFRGAVRHVSADELAASTLSDDTYVKAELGVSLSAIGPVFGIGAMSDDEFWAHSHYEQHVKLEGELAYAGLRIPLRATGMRDHSVGPRDTNALDRHTWSHGEFPSGRLFMAMDVDAADGTALRYVVIGDGNAVSEAALRRPGATLLGSPEEALGDYAIELEAEGGSTAIRAEILQTLPLSLRGTNDWVLGTRPDAHHMMFESQTRFEWEGETGYGLTERSVRA